MKLNFAKIIGICAATTIAFGACSKENSQENLAQVKTFTARLTPHSTKLKAFGTVTYGKKNDITALVEGTIYELNVKEGDKVKKGDVLLRMKNIQYEIQRSENQNQVNSAAASLESSKNNLTKTILNVNSQIMSLENSRLNLAQKQDELCLVNETLEKNETLFEAGGVSKQDIAQMRLNAQGTQTEIEILQKKIQIEELGFRDEDLILAGYIPSDDKEERRNQLIELNTRSAQLEIEIAKVNLQNARENLKSTNTLIENLTVRASSDGIVGVLNFENGEHVMQNEKLMTIVDVSSPYTIVSIQEKDMQGIEIGSEAELEVSSLNDFQRAKIEFIAPVADMQTGNFNVKIPMKNDDNKIKLGMFVRCSIQTKKSGNFFILPESIVLKRDGNRISFYSVQNEILVIKNCIVDMERDGNFFIESGISDGEKIVENPSSALREGMHVKAI